MMGMEGRGSEEGAVTRFAPRPLPLGCKYTSSTTGEVLRSMQGLACMEVCEVDGQVFGCSPCGPTWRLLHEVGKG